jgi:hypothetical protein
MRHAGMIWISRLGIGLVPVGRRLIILWPWCMIEWRTSLSLPALLLDRDLGVDSPEVSFAFFVALHEGIVLA